MPRSAIETGVADMVVPPDKIGGLLSRYANAKDRESFLAELATDSANEPMLQMIFSALQRDFGIDFRHYKPGTMLRRLHRRSVLSNCASVEEYANTILTDETERRALYNDLLIGVTNFFRDPEMFQALRREVEECLEVSWKEELLRIWVCGCSTGEEAYSIAMLFHDLIRTRNEQQQVKIFATDIDRNSLEIAGRGHYSSEAIKQIPSHFASRYFRASANGFQIVPEIRQMITFAPHNVLRDAPFTNLNLVTCRNLLIYLTSDAQQKVLSLLYFGLRSNGLLFLGSSETPGDFANEVRTLDNTSRIFMKTSATRSNLIQKPAVDLLGSVLPPPRPSPRNGQPGMITPELLSVYDLLLSEYMSSALLVNQEGSVVQVFGDGARYLRITPGRMSTKLSDLVNEDLLLAITGMVHRVRKYSQPAELERLRIRSNDSEEYLRVFASLLKPKSGQSFVLIRFEPLDQQHPPADRFLENHNSLLNSAAEERDELSIELRFTKENLNATIEELQTTNEELQATNEEMIASNEELQSTNEELHSVNEELYTVNAEYQKKIIELTKLNNDFDNLLASTEIHTVFLDNELNIRMFTPKAVEIFNFSAGDIGRNFESFTNKLHLSSLPNDLKQVLQSGKSIEHEVVDKRGRSFLLRILPYLASGQTCGVVISLLDISARIEWEQRLQNSNDRFERAIAATRDGIWDWPDIGIDEMWWSPMCYELLGYAPGEFAPLYSRWIGLIHPDDVGRIRETTLPHQAKCYVELHRSFEYRMRHKSGSYYWFQHRVLVIYDDSGKPIRMTGSIVDIQVRKELEDSLREQVRQRDDFLAILSHELRNPLGALTNALALAKRPQIAFEQQQKALQVIQEQSQHMRRMLDDLLDVSRVSHKKFELRKTVFHLQDTVSDVLDSLKSRAEQNGIDLRLNITERPIKVFADRDRILQCQVNLVGNAIKFTKSGGQVDYSIQMRDNMACIEIKDNGVGMSEYLSQHTFELFSQGANEPRNKESGIGVGLSLVRSIVELHSGRVTAFSEGLGKGSTFTMLLPICEEDSLLEESQPQQREIRIDPGHRVGRKVLVIDDLPEGRSMLAQLLSLDGYEVFEADTGASGLQVALEKNVDIAIIDLGLPDLTGYEVAEKIQESPAGKAMKLIALTGYGQPSDLQKTKDAGFHYHLTKPVELERLFELLASEESSSHQ